ncbi:MAG TPA: heavy metal translocating P-type ATPase [Candidatus Angelobacter sp.]|nr:heavy metal translocating P-type ATPase [Candidatus Angelobacter sp.]
MTIAYPAPGHLRISGVAFFSSPGARELRKFISGMFLVAEVAAIEISTSLRIADIFFDKRCTAGEFAGKVRAKLVAGGSGVNTAEERDILADSEGRISVHRNGEGLSSWRIVSDIPGRIRVRSSQIFRKKQLCQEIERELTTVAGVRQFKVNPLTCSVLIFFNPLHVSRLELIRVLDDVLAVAADQNKLDAGNHELLLCTAVLGFAAVAQFWAHSLLLPASVLFVWSALPTLAGARDTLLKERRLGVDVLDSLVVVMCLIGNQIFAGAVLAWCLSFGRLLLQKAQEDSRRRLVNVFGKQPRTALLYKDGTETSVPLDMIRTGDTIAVHTGQVVPVDGIVLEGAAIVDQHALTGESVPVERGPGGLVLASTLLVGGRILVTVEKAGRETTSARISAILNDTAAFRLSSQSKGEELADKAVIPTLVLASIGLGTVGLQGATAVINCDFGTGIRMAAPLALLSSLSVCANRGILIKDGMALEQIGSIDTMVFDKTGTLTQEKPSVSEVHRFGHWSKTKILTLAAAAEQSLTHPIARAIVEKFQEIGTPLPQLDRSSYKIGYGISVNVESLDVRVGSIRFMQMEGVAVPPEAEEMAENVHDEGHSIVFVSVDGAVAGAIELIPALREGVRELIAELRRLGIRQTVIISGDHERPTEKLAQYLGVDRYFAEVLPEDKARYVALLQEEGRRVCFVGDGINDSIALKRANVSISLRGASSVAIDTAQVVFMEDNLTKLVELIDLSRRLDRNVQQSWAMILVPNLLCIAGAFFLGFGVMASVLANNVAAMAALANGLRPLRMLREDTAASAGHRKGSQAQWNASVQQRWQIFLETPWTKGNLVTQ